MNLLYSFKDEQEVPNIARFERTSQYLRPHTNMYINENILI